jgi:hypothetical protein
MPNLTEAVMMVKRRFAVGGVRKVNKGLENGFFDPMTGLSILLDNISSIQ